MPIALPNIHPSLCHGRSKSKDTSPAQHPKHHHELKLKGNAAKEMTI